jgi:hypothetical protein
MPYGEVYLLLLPILFVTAGVVALSRAGREIGGEDLGFFVLCVAVTSSILVRQGGWELRQYAFLFCFSSATLLYYVKRSKEETTLNIVLYGISLTLLLFSHYFGSILALFYGLTDLCLWLRRKIAFKCVLSYLMAGVLFVPWIILVFIHHSGASGTFWAQPPKFTEPLLIIAYLLSNSLPCCLLFGTGFLMILFREKESAASNIWRCSIGSILWVLLTVFCYSKFINPGGSMFFDRYFFVILPHVFLVTAYAAVWIYDVSTRKGAFAGTALRCSLLLLLLGVAAQNYHKSFLSVTSPWPFDRDIAEYLSRDRKVHSEDSLVIVADAGLAFRGWIDYYFAARGYEVPSNIAHIPQGDSIYFL